MHGNHSKGFSDSDVRRANEILARIKQNQSTLTSTWSSQQHMAAGSSARDSTMTSVDSAILDSRAAQDELEQLGVYDSSGRISVAAREAGIGESGW